MTQKLQRIKYNSESVNVNCALKSFATCVCNFAMLFMAWFKKIVLKTHFVTFLMLLPSFINKNALKVITNKYVNTQNVADANLYGCNNLKKKTLYE